MKSTLSIMALATVLFILCNNLVCAEVVIVYDPDTGTSRPIVVIGGE